jgi:penicillin-insensitive murein endopeptidase
MRPVRARPSIWFLLSTLLGGCVGVPTPLAPSLRGSVGVPHLGVQTDATELPKAGLGFVRYRAFGQHYWGLPRLVRAIESSAAEVDRKFPGGAALVVGDLSARHGGKIVGHNSHRSGRDVDLLYYVTTPAGAPVASPGFVRLESDGLGVVPETGEFVRFDVARQWQLVRSLVTSKDVGVQFLFMSRALEALVIDYALALGEPLELVYRAETVLLQPTDSLPHDDHMHMRIACAPEELALGCSGGGPYWQWLPEPAAEPELDAGLLGLIAADDPFLSDAELAGGSHEPPGGA